jgi:hypothetical protein
MSKLRGKGYDGASNMSGCFKGVKARIQEIQPLAVFTHCVGHVLNLVVEDSCENPFVRDTINTVKEAINFFKVSVQRESILKVDRKIKFIELLEPVITSLEQTKNTRPCNPATTTKATNITNTFEEELYLWKEKWKNVENEKRPKNSIENLKNCNEDLYPSICNILSILCVIPLTTTECERNFSSLRLIKSYLRSTMTNQRLHSIALHYIHNDRLPTTEEVFKIYIESGLHRF